MKRRQVLNLDTLKSIVSSKQASGSAEDRLTQYLKVADKAGVSYKCFDPGVALDQLDSGQVTMDGTKALVRIDGPLDWFWGIDVNQIVRDLDEAKPESIEMRINSPGGFLYDGLYLYHDLRNRAKDGVAVSSLGQGIVGSAAVLPFLAADERAMPEGSQIFTHKPYTFAFLIGNVDEMKDQFESIIAGLEAATESMTELYASRLDQTKAQISELLSKDRWFGPEQAKEEGFTNADAPADAPEENDDDPEEARYREQARETLEAITTRGILARTLR